MKLCILGEISSDGEGEYLVALGYLEIMSIFIVGCLSSERRFTFFGEG